MSEQGWYPDPDPSAPPKRLRWWDGQNWTPQTRDDTPSTGQSPVALGKPAGPRPAPEPVASAYPSSNAWDGYEVRGGYGYAGPGMDPVTGRPLGNQWLRLLARVIDNILVSTVSTILLFVVAGDRMRSLVDSYRELVNMAVSSASPEAVQQQMDRLYADLIPVAVAGVVITALYHIVLIGWRGQTVGKLICGLRVEPADRAAPRPGWGKAVLRWAGSNLLGNLPWVGPLYLLLDAMFCLFDSRRQTIHDKIARTVVVKARP